MVLGIDLCLKVLKSLFLHHVFSQNTYGDKKAC